MFARLLRLSALIPALAVLAANARAEPSCAYRPAPPSHLAAVGAVVGYDPILRRCVAADGRGALAVRTMKVGGRSLLLLADPQALTTRLESAACWTCRDIGEGEVAATRMMRAIASSAEAPGLRHRGFLTNAGLTHGVGPGAYVTGDLCPSLRPLDRPFFTRLQSLASRPPVALSISGLWLVRHFADFRWLVAERDAGALDILWVDHSYHHPYRPGAPATANFLLTPGVDAQAEILDTERLLIANGETPSLFFRFPGLVSNAPLMEAARRLHLITLGADAWLALNNKPGAGSIILVHPNGNEPSGLALFSRDVDRGAVARPFLPLTAAPN